MSSDDKVYLGVHKGYGRIWLTKHKWDCGWYWSFGYVGNNECHFHIDSLIKHPEKYERNWTDVSHHFSETWLNQEQWWILRDLFLSAYALKQAANAYVLGGHQTDKAIPWRVTSPEMAKQINADLEVLLDNIWNLLLLWRESVK